MNFYRGLILMSFGALVFTGNYYFYHISMQLSDISHSNIPSDSVFVAIVVISVFIILSGLSLVLKKK